MNKLVLGFFFISAIVMDGCALEAGDGGEDSVESVDQELVAVIFRGVGNTGFDNQSDKTATIAANNLSNASAKGSLGIAIKVDDTAPFEAGSIRTADCGKRTVTVTYKQADIQQFSATTPPARVRNGHCNASVLLEWSKGNPPGTVRLVPQPPTTTISQQRVTLSAMPLTPAVGNITVVTKTNGVANADKYAFRIDRAP